MIKKLGLHSESPTLVTMYSEATSASIVETNVKATNKCLFKVLSITVINQQVESLYDITDKNKSPIKRNADCYILI